MAFTYNWTGTANNDTIRLGIINGGAKPSTTTGGDTWNLNALGGLVDVLDLTQTGYSGTYNRASFIIGTADASGVIVVTGASSGGNSKFTFKLTNVEVIKFSDQIYTIPTVDTTPPTLAITSSVSALKAGQTATISFTFSEDPLATFTAADIITTGGTLGALSGTGLVRTATFTPTANLNAGTASITVASGSYTDAALNPGGAGTTPSITFDTLAPTVAITSDKSALSSGQTAAITFTFSEDPGTSFIASDITPTGGTLGALSGTGLTRTATFTPTATSGTATVTVANASYTDAALNPGGAGTTPTIAISSIGALDILTDTGTSATDFITQTAAQTITATLGTALVSGQTLRGSVNNGTTWSNISVSGTAINWTGATLSGSSTIKLEVRDAANNVVSSASQAYVLDTVAPTVAITSSSPLLHAGETATISFTFSEDPGLTFIASDITTTGGVLSGLTTTGLVRTATFTPTAAVASGTASITVANLSYTDTAGNTGSAGTTPTIIFKTLVPTTTVTGLDISSDTGISATDFITQTAAQTITGTLSAVLGGDKLYGTVDNGTIWSDISSKVSGTAINWTGATLLDGSHTLMLEVRNTDNAGTVASQSYVIDNAAPTVATFSPANAATGVAVGSNIVLNFSEAIQRGTVVDSSIVIHSGTPTGVNAVVETFTAATSTNLAISGSALTINPTADLTTGTHYYITLANGSIDDLAGNHYAGTSAYDFTTASAATAFAASDSGGGGGAGVALAGVGALGLLVFVLL